MASAEERCVYESAREGFIATETGSGFDIAFPDDAQMVDEAGKTVAVKAGDVFDHCTNEPGDLTRYSHCKNGWSGVLLVAGKSLDDRYGSDIMFLQNEIWYRRCTTDAGL